MKVSAREIEQRQMVLEIEVEDERVEKALDQAYKRIVNRINVPGFRRGRAPRALVERMVGREAILEDAVEHLVPEVYRDALQEQAIETAGQPSVQVTSTEPLQFKATVPLKPTVVLGDYRSIDVPLEPIVTEDTEIEAVIDNLREANLTWVPVERAVRVGDRVGLTARAVRGERVMMDSPDAEFVVNPDGPEPAPGFSEKLVGAEAGQELTFSLGGEPAEEGGEPSPTTDFTVQVHWVKEKQLPEADDEFARLVSQKETMDELREDIRQQLRARKEQQARERQRDAIVQAAVEQATVEAPPQAVEREAGQILDTMASTLDKQGISIEQYLQFTGKDEQTFRSELLADAEKSLKRTLVLEAIADAEGLTPDEAEVRGEIELAAQGTADAARTVRQAMGRPETVARVTSILKSRKGAQRLMELAGGSPPVSATAEAASDTSGETHE